MYGIVEMMEQRRGVEIGKERREMRGERREKREERKREEREEREGCVCVLRIHFAQTLKCGLIEPPDLEHSEWP